MSPALTAARQRSLDLVATLRARLAERFTDDPRIDTLAALFDAQFDPETREHVTSIEPKSGRRIATGWLVLTTSMPSGMPSTAMRVRARAAPIVSAPGTVG